MNSLNEAMSLLNDHLSSINQFHINKIGIFGSFVRGEQTTESDVDIIVEFDEDQETLDNYMDLKFYPEELFGRNVDLDIEGNIKDVLRRLIAEEVYYVNMR